MSLKTTVSVNVRNLRQKADLTQEQLSDRAGMAAGYIARLESQPQNVTLDVVERLAKALGCTVEEIVGGTIDPRAVDASHLLDEAISLIQRYKDFVASASEKKDP